MKIISKFLSLLLCAFCFLSGITPVIAEEETETYFNFDEWYVTMETGSSHVITYNCSSDLTVEDSYIASGSDVIDYDKETHTITAKATGTAQVNFKTSGTWTDVYTVNVTVGYYPTSFKFTSNPYNIFINTSVDDANKNFYVYGSYEPNASYVFTDTNYVIDDPDDVVEDLQSASNPYFTAKKSGEFTLTGTTVYGNYSDTTKVHVYMGNYATGITGPNYIYKLIDVGETLNLNEVVKSSLLPENGDFSDENFNWTIQNDQGYIELKDGIVTGLRKSNYAQTVTGTLANGNTISYMISVGSEPTTMSFGQNEYSYSKNSGRSLKWLLTSDNNDSIRYVSNDEITWSVDDASKISLNPEWDSFSCNETGDVTLTAKYKDLTASTVIHIYEGDADPYAFEYNDSSYVKLSVGNTKKLNLTLGSSNEITNVEISDKSCVSFDKDTLEVKALKTCNYVDVKLTDKLGKSLTFYVTAGEEATSFNFLKDSMIATRNSKSDVSNRSYNINYSTEPSSAQSSTNITYEVIDGDKDVITFSSYGGFQVNKSGVVTVKGTTDNGLSDTIVIDARVGNYSTYLNASNSKVKLKIGETYNIKDEIYASMEPAGADFSEEVLTYEIADQSPSGIISVSADGTITANKNGTAIVYAKTVNGDMAYINVSVYDSLDSFEFERDKYYIDLSSSVSQISLNGSFSTDPIYAEYAIDYSKVKFTSSDDSIAKVNGTGTSYPVLYGYKEGTITLTAEYEGKKATTKVQVYTPSTPTKWEVPDEITVHAGYSRSLIPSYNATANKSSAFEIISGSDAISINPYSSGCYIEATKEGEAVLRVTSSTNSKLTKDVKIHVVSGNPTDATFSVSTLLTNEELDQSDTYNLELNESYNFTVKSIEALTTNYMEVSYFQKALDESSLFELKQMGSDTALEEVSVESYSLTVVSCGTETIEVYPGLKITFNVGFDDVTEETAHVEDVTWLANTGISTGYPDGTFRPLTTVARCDMAAFIRRLAVSMNYGDASTWTPTEADWNTFTDVNKDTYHAEDVLWLAHAGISEGWTEKDGSKTFRPMNIVERADMAAFLHRLASKMKLSDAESWKPSGSEWNVFSDVNSSVAHQEDILWLAHSGVSEGWTENGSKTFRPFTQVARCDMAAFLHRLANLS